MPLEHFLSKFKQKTDASRQIDRTFHGQTVVFMRNTTFSRNIGDVPADIVLLPFCNCFVTSQNTQKIK